MTSATGEDDANNNEEGMTTRDKKEATSASMKEGGNAGASTKEGCNAGDNEQMTVDTALYCIMHKAKIDCFKDLDDAYPIIENYKTMTRNRLQIQQSVVDKFRAYCCSSHVACPFLLRFSKRHSDGKFDLLRMNPKHS